MGLIADCKNNLSWSKNVISDLLYYLLANETCARYERVGSKVVLVVFPIKARRWSRVLQSRSLG
jgi:hypothetical protein